MLHTHTFFVATVLCFFTVLAAADPPRDSTASERPTADAVAAAVARSRAAYAEAHPVPSKQQMIASIQKQIDDTQAGMRKLTGTSAAMRVEQMYREIQTLKKELAEVRRKYAPEPVTRLSAFTNKDFKIGSVGRLNDATDDSPAYCVQTLEGDSMTAYFESPPKSGDAASKEESAPRDKSQVFLLRGANASAATAGQPIKGAFDVVVTEKTAIEDEKGAMQTVFVLEVFDPNRTFGN